MEKNSLIFFSVCSPTIRQRVYRLSRVSYATDPSVGRKRFPFGDDKIGKCGDLMCDAYRKMVFDGGVTIDQGKLKSRFTIRHVAEWQRTGHFT